MARAELQVQIVYALAEQQVVLALKLPADSCVSDAITSARAISPQIFLTGVADSTVAIYGRLVTLTQVLRDGDRVELLRPLIADPKDQRLARIVRARKARKSN